MFIRYSRCHFGWHDSLHGVYRYPARTILGEGMVIAAPIWSFYWTFFSFCSADWNHSIYFLWQGKGETLYLLIPSFSASKVWGQLLDTFFFSFGSQPWSLGVPRCIVEWVNFYLYWWLDASSCWVLYSYCIYLKFQMVDISQGVPTNPFGK